MISARDITKSFGTAALAGRTVLSGVSLDVAPGEFVALSGRSGSGKSTLLHILAGLDRPDSGSVTVNDIEITKRSAEELAQFRLDHIGLVFQFFNFLPTLSLLENVALPAYLRGEPKQAARKRAADILARVGLEEAAPRLPHEVSGGELQRAAIGRAMVNRPAVVLADEPTGNLDDENSERVLEIFRSLVTNERVTVLMVTHDAAVRRAADRTVVIANGAIAQAAESGAAAS